MEWQIMMGLVDFKRTFQLPLKGFGPLYAEFFHSATKGIDMHFQR
jgi:hypothetical protein